MALLLSTSLALQPVSYAFAADTAVVADNAMVSETQSANMEMDDSVDVQAAKKTATYSGGIRNGMVAYDDQTGKIKAAQKKITIPLGGTDTVKFTGIDATARDVSFVSSDPTKVQVDADGNVYGIKTGSASITMWYNGKKARTRVKVAKSKENGTQNLIETYTGNGRKATKIKIKGAKKKELTYSENTMTETVTTSSGGTVEEKKNVVYVTSKYSTVSYASYEEKPQAVETNVTVAVGETKTLQTSGVVEGIKWKSSSKKFVAVDSLGRVTGVKVKKNKAKKVKIIGKVGKTKLVYYVTVDPSKTPDEDPDTVANEVRVANGLIYSLSPGGRILGNQTNKESAENPSEETPKEPDNPIPPHDDNDDNIQTFSINYDLNDESGDYNSDASLNGIVVTSYTSEDGDIVIEDPAREGYEFEGWSVNTSDILQTNLVIKKGTTGDLSLKAYWKIKEYALEFNLNGGKLSEDDIEGLALVPSEQSANCFLYGAEYGSNYYVKAVAERITREGYTLKGFAVNGEIFTYSTPIKKDYTFTAIWGVNTVPYKVNYYFENLDGEYELESTDEMTADAFSEVSPIPGEYAGFETPEIQTAEVKAEGSTEIDYKYKRNSYFVTFVDSVTGEEEKKAVKYGGILFLPDYTEKTGYTFQYWKDEETGTVILDTTITPTSDAKYIAEYKPITADIIFVQQATPGESETILHGTKATYDEGLQLPDNNSIHYVRYGYNFRGWSLSSNILWYHKFTSQKYSFTDGQKLSANDVNILLTEYNNKGKIYLYDICYPIWYGVTLYPNGGSGEKYSVQYWAFETKALPKNTFEREGYDFVGWSNYSNDTKAQIKDEGNFTMGTGSVTVGLYAIWKPKTYTVSFNAGQWGKVSINEIQVTQDKPYGTLPTPTRNGNIFKGWYTKENGEGALVTEDTIMKQAKGHTLYAKWEAMVFTCTLSPNGTVWSDTGTDELRTIQVSYGSAWGDYKLPSTKAKGCWTNWNLRSNGTGSIYSGLKIKPNPIADFTIYSSANANKYQITFINDGATVSGTEVIRDFYGSALPDIEIPQKDGYVFDGYYDFGYNAGWDKIDTYTKWYDSEGKPLKETMPDYNFTVHAHWRQPTPD